MSDQDLYEAQTMLKAIAQKHGITTHAILGPSRKRLLVKARLEFIQEARSKGWTVKKIGNLLGGRDHTTIIHHLQTMDKKKWGMWKHA